MAKLKLQTTIKRADLAAWICGLADSSVWIAFMLSSRLDYYYAISVSAKLLALVIFFSIAKLPKLDRLVVFAIPFVISSCASVVAGYSYFDGIPQLAGFFISLFITLSFISDANYIAYMKSFSLSIFAGAVVYLAFAYSGQIEVVWERWLYFGGEQPNLGGEILYSGVLAATLHHKKPNASLVFFIAVSVIAIFLLEARSALIATCAACLIWLYYTVLRAFRPGKIFLIIVCVATATLFVLIFMSDTVWNVIDKSLFLDNEYRGIGSGFSGRIERWSYAMETFIESPIFGVGVGYFRDVSMTSLTPHNFWLYMLTDLGLLGVLSLAVIAICLKGLWKENRFIFWMVMSSLPLTMFNDRFVNMNPYPFLIFVLLFLPPGIYKKAYFAKIATASKWRSQAERIEWPPPIAT
jgi:O-antigen ligase